MAPLLKVPMSMPDRVRDDSVASLESTTSSGAATVTDTRSSSYRPPSSVTRRVKTIVVSAVSPVGAVKVVVAELESDSDTVFPEVCVQE